MCVCVCMGLGLVCWFFLSHPLWSTMNMYIETFIFCVYHRSNLIMAWSISRNNANHFYSLIHLLIKKVPRKPCWKNLLVVVWLIAFLRLFNDIDMKRKQPWRLLCCQWIDHCLAVRDNHCLSLNKVNEDFRNIDHRAIVTLTKMTNEKTS